MTRTLDEFIRSNQYDDNPTMWVLCGLPRSGKTTHGHKIVDSADYGAGVYVVCSRDMVRAAYGTIFDEKLEGMVREVHQKMVETMLLTGYDVIVDECNIKRSARDKWHKTAEDGGYKVNLIVVNCEQDVAMERCVETHFPVEVWVSMANNWEEPTDDEKNRYCEVYYVETKRCE